MQNNNRIIFEVPGENTLVDIIEGILKDNGLAESAEDFFFNTANRGKELRVVIIRDTALVILQKKIPTEKIIELLQKHLQINSEIAGKILQDIKEKLIPLAKVANSTGAQEITKKPTDKNITTLRQEKEDINTIKKRSKGPDIYREPIE